MKKKIPKMPTHLAKKRHKKIVAKTKVAKPTKAQRKMQQHTEVLKKATLVAEKEWNDIIIACKHARRVLLFGPPGTGKSYIGTAVDNKALLSRLYLTMDTPAAEVRGHYLPNENGSFSWHDGPGVHAWRQGGRLVIDEIDAASGDTLTLLLALLDDPESAQLTLPTNETIRPKDGFSCVATTNQLPSVLPEALLDRFDVVIHVPKPSPFAFRPNCWNNQALSFAAQKAIYLTDGPQKGAGGRPVGLRAFKAIDRLHNSGLPMDHAARLVIGEEAGRWLMTAMTLGG